MCSIQMILWEVYAYKNATIATGIPLAPPSTKPPAPPCKIILIATRLSFDPVNIKIITYLHLTSAYAETKHFLADLGGKLKKKWKELGK